MSLGGGDKSQAMNDVINQLFQAGVPVAVAAGNEAHDACLSSPADSPQAITVGASTQNDFRASFSNFGNCVSIFAPGDKIESAWSTADDDLAIASGTSQATPHVAAVLALILQAYPTATVQEAYSILLGLATNITLGNTTTDDPNLLLYSSVYYDTEVHPSGAGGSAWGFFWSVFRLSWD
ncbi:hypothetical protein HDU76_000263 [Blyttiomyces sp. JEL0837]|nr:hypothetical protein HDU76_000263 [Blyttiomyces sp. JEL0837]